MRSAMLTAHLSPGSYERGSVLFSFPMRELELIHAKAREDRGEIGFERANGFWRRSLVTHIGFLHHILGIHRTTEHAVGDGKEDSSGSVRMTLPCACLLLLATPQWIDVFVTPPRT
jgi:hypothetical protein